MAADTIITGNDGGKRKISARTFNENEKPNECITESDKGNYRQANEALARKLGVSTNVIKEYAENNNMTWHECRDGVTMQLIPTDMNRICKHSGGVSMLSDEIKNGKVIYEEPKFQHYSNSNSRS